MGAWYNSRLGPPSTEALTITDIRGVLTYNPASNGSIPTPQSTSRNLTNINCSDIDYSLLRQNPTFFDQSYSVALQDPSVTYTFNYTFPSFVGTEVRTLVNDSLYTVDDTAEPTLYAIQQDPTWMPPSTEQRNLMTIPDQYDGENVRIVVLVTGKGTHPFHMHGHPFQVVASGIGPFDDAVLAEVNAVNLRDVIVRDTAVVQAGGWIVIQYVFPRSRTICNENSHVGIFPAGLQPTIRVFGLCIAMTVS